MKYAWIASQLAAHSVRSLCRALHVSPSGFYAWRGRAPSARSRENQRLVEVIRTVHTEFRQAYGTEKLWRELRDRGESCGRHRVARLRQRHQIVTQRRCRFVTARAAYDRTPPAPRIFTWPFASPAPNRIWASDITQIPTRRGWLYLAIVLDAFSRRVVGWAMSDRIQQELASSALSMALKQRRPGTRPGPSQRQGFAVHQQSLSSTVGGRRHRNEHEPTGHAIRQRDGRELLQLAQETN